MNLIHKTLLVLCLFSLSQLTLATAVEGLYSATVEVADQSRSQRQQGFSQALADVLIKTTGTKDIAARPGVSQALSQASNYMVKYAYLPQSDAGSVDTQASSGFLLSVQFARAAVDELMRTLDLPIWPSNRPQVLVWVVEQTRSGGYRFVDTDDLPRRLEESFQRRGLPYQLPLYDLDDQLTLNAVAAWSLNQRQLQNAAKRYGADHWLVLRYSPLSSGELRGSWYLAGSTGDFSGNGALLNTLQAASTNEFLNISVDQVADRFAQQMTYFANVEANLFRLVVDNIGSFADFTQLDHFLEGLQIVNGIHVRSIEGDTLVLDLVTEGDSRVLLRALNKEPRLSRVTQMVTTDVVELPASSSAPSISPPSTSFEHFRWQAAR